MCRCLCIHIATQREDDFVELIFVKSIDYSSKTAYIYFLNYSSQCGYFPHYEDEYTEANFK